MTERYPSARKYRDVFERIKKSITDIIAQGKHEPRHPVHLDPSVQEGVPKFQGHWEPDMGMGNEYNFMINNSKHLFCKFQTTHCGLPKGHTARLRISNPEVL